MPGRRPKPSHLKVIAGNPGKRKLNEHEPKPARGVPRMPSYLAGKERDLWKKVGPLLDRTGVLTESDGQALELLCQAYADYRTARDVVLKAGYTYSTTTPQGDTMYRPRPEVAQMTDAWNRVMRGLVEFGLTPAARSKVKTGAETQDDEARFFGT